MMAPLSNAISSKGACIWKQNTSGSISIRFQWAKNEPGRSMFQKDEKVIEGKWAYREWWIKPEGKIQSGIASSILRITAENMDKHWPSTRLLARPSSIVHHLQIININTSKDDIICDRSHSERNIRATDKTFK
jgi:hypothetical protein